MCGFRAKLRDVYALCGLELGSKNAWSDWVGQSIAKPMCSFSHCCWASEFCWLDSKPSTGTLNLINYGLSVSYFSYLLVAKNYRHNL